MEIEAVSSFEFKRAPIGRCGNPIGSMPIDETVCSDLEGRSLGHMFAYCTGVESSVGCAAMEQVTATLDGPENSLTRQHSGLIDKSAPWRTVVVVPDPVTQSLSGLTGMINIVAAPAWHDCRFRHSLPV